MHPCHTWALLVVKNRCSGRALSEQCVKADALMGACAPGRVRCRCCQGGFSSAACGLGRLQTQPPGVPAPIGSAPGLEHGDRLVDHRVGRAVALLRCQLPPGLDQRNGASSSKETGRHKSKRCLEPQSTSELDEQAAEPVAGRPAWQAGAAAQRSATSTPNQLPSL